MKGGKREGERRRQEAGARDRKSECYRGRELDREWGGKEERSDRVEVKKECYAR